MRGVERASKTGSLTSAWLPSVFLTVYGVFAAAVFLWPIPVDGFVSSWLSSVISGAQQLGLGWFTYYLVQFSANVVFFVPIGCAIARLAPAGTWWWGAVICAALSLTLSSSNSWHCPSGTHPSVTLSPTRWVALWVPSLAG